MKRRKVPDFVRKPFLALIGCCRRRPASPIFSGIACFGDLTMNIGTRSRAGGRAFGQSLALFALILGLLVLQVESGTAGPVLPEQRVISDELLSLVGVASSRLQVNVRQPGATAAVGLPVESLKVELEEICAGQGFEISSDPDDMVIVIHVSLHDNIDHPTLMGYVVHLALEQEMHMPRLNRSMVVPTYTLLESGFCATEEIRDMASAKLRIVMQTFLNHISRANVTEK